MVDAIEQYLQDNHLFVRDAEGMVLLPLLFSGELVTPRRPSLESIRSALGTGRFAALDDVVVVADEAVGESGAAVTTLFVMPRVTSVDRIASVRPAQVAAELHDMPVADAVAYSRRVFELLTLGSPLLARVRALQAFGSEGEPPEFVDASSSQPPEDWTALVDAQLAYMGRKGSAYLDGWVEADAPRTGVWSALAGVVAGGPELPFHSRAVRAIPTRQLHITAGNSPTMALRSCARALAVKSPVTAKIAGGALPSGAALAVAMHFAGPRHPLARLSSVAYWKGGDRAIEDLLFDARRFDRVVVWGSPETVDSVSRRAANIKTIVFNPRFGMSFIARGALEQMEETVRRSATDVMISNQKACVASLVHYVEGTPEDAARYCRALTEQLGAWERRFPNALSPSELARARQVRRGDFMQGTWYGDAETMRYGVVHMPHHFDVSAHPMTRVVVVRDVASLESLIERLNRNVSVVGIWPAERRIALRDAICAQGVSCVLPLGEVGTFLSSAMPHDNLLPLSELVSWVSS